MSQERFNNFSNSKNFTVYGQVKSGVDASRKKARVNNSSNPLTKRLGGAAKLAIVSGILLYSSYVGYNAYKSLDNLIDKRIQTIEQSYNEAAGISQQDTVMKAKLGGLGR